MNRNYFLTKQLRCSDFSWRCAQDQGQCPGGGGYILGDCGNSEVTLPPTQPNPPNPTDETTESTTDDGQPDPTTESTTDDGSDGTDGSGAMSVKSSIVLSSMVALIAYLQN